MLAEPATIAMWSGDVMSSLVPGEARERPMLATPIGTGKMTRLESAPTTKVLIIERHAAVRRALRKRLSATPDLDVVAAVQDAGAALPYLDGKGESIVVPDVVLLGMQSSSDEELFATLGVVRQMARCPTAIIVLAPYADEVERLLLQQAGASSYLLKYIDSYRLIQEIQTVACHDQDALAPG